MTAFKLENHEFHTFGDLPAIGEKVTDFALCRTDLSVASLEDFAGRPMLINVYPSIDTAVCFDSVNRFNAAVDGEQDLAIVCVSMDSPFALQRIEMSESLGNVTLLSDFRNRDFGDSYGLTIADGPLAGLLARAVIVLDKDHQVLYRELVSDISHSPNFDAALDALK